VNHVENRYREISGAKVDGFVAEEKKSMKIFCVFVVNDAKGRLVSSKTENTTRFPSLLSTSKEKPQSRRANTTRSCVVGLRKEGRYDE
jgi:hypothetical protein